MCRNGYYWITIVGNVGLQTLIELLNGFYKRTVYLNIWYNGQLLGDIIFFSRI